MLFAADYLPWDQVGSLVPINCNDGHFEKCSNIEKDVFCLVMNMGQKKNLNPHHESKLQNFGFYTAILYHGAAGTPL